MEENQKEHIRVNLATLIDSTRCNLQLLDKLYQAKILSDFEKKKLLAKEDNEKSSHLYDYLKTRHTDTYMKFVKVLRECELDVPADILEKLYKKENTNRDIQPSVKTIMKMKANGVTVLLKDVEYILNKVGHRKLIFLAICGKMRTGKSFMLSLVIHYLTSGQSTNWMADFLNNPNNFFKWRKGGDPMTQGVNIWSEPFFLTGPNGDETAVVLMDCQGAFDQKTTSHQNSLIFAMAALLSSVFIYNVQGGITEEAINPFLIFMETAMRAVGNQRTKVLQRLLILSRDVDEDDYKPGFYSAAETPNGSQRDLYMETFHPVEASKETTKSREHILANFENVAVYAMAYPGDSLARKDDPSKLETDFVKSVTDFMNFLFSEENMLENCKAFQGTQMTGQSCLPLFHSLAEKFNKNELPQLLSLFTNVAETENNAVKGKSLKIYNEKMEINLSTEEHGLPNPRLLELHNGYYVDSLEYFRGQFLFGDQELKDSCEERLKLEIKESFEVFRQRNEHKLEAKISADKLLEEERLKNIALVNKQIALQDAEEAKKQSKMMKAAMIKQGEVTVQEAERQLEFAKHKKSLINREHYVYNETTFEKHRTTVVGFNGSPVYRPVTKRVLNQGQYDTAIAIADADIKEAENRLKVAKQQLEIAKNS